MPPNKTCPVVIREHDSGKQILLFHHPLAGVQLAKGTIEADESQQSAAERELFEEAGVRLRALEPIGQWQYCPASPIWYFWQMEDAGHLPERWVQHCLDDGGHDFEFFWHPLNSSYPSSNNDQWRAIFVAAFEYLQIYFKR